MSSIQRKNRMLLLYDTISKLIMFTGTILENYFDGARVRVIIVTAAFCILEMLINYVAYMKNKESIWVQYIVACNLFVLFVIMVLCVETFWIFFIPFPMLAAFTVFEDKKVIVAVGLGCNIVNLIGIIRHMHVVYRNDRYTYNAWISVTEIIILLAYTVSIFVTSNMIKEENRIKLEDVEKEQHKTTDLSSNVMMIGNSIKESAYEVDDIINELDKLTESTLVIFDKIKNGNDDNIESVRKQSQMTSNIKDMIDGVQDNVGMANVMTTRSIKELEYSKTSVNDLKAKSHIIIKNNDELIKAINYFLQSITKIKYLVDSISKISSKTDMLALNASIESARAGEDGRGFIHVANEISNIADETESLANEIVNVITMLENNAIKARNLVANVAKEVNEENNMLDLAIEEFEEMNNNMVGLGGNLKVIFEKVGHVVNYRKEIEKNSKELEESSNEVSKTTKETVLLNKENKLKTVETKKLIQELMELSSEIDGI